MKIKNDKGETMKAGGIIINEERKILLLTILGRDVWSYPKGHMEEGETEEVTARREILEETGYEVEILKKLSDITYTNQETSNQIRIHMFLMRPISKISDGEDGIIKNWFTVEEARSKLAPNLTFLLAEV